MSDECHHRQCLHPPPPGMSPGFFVLSADTVQYFRALLLFSFHADTGCAAFECALVSVLGDWREHEQHGEFGRERCKRCAYYCLFLLRVSLANYLLSSDLSLQAGCMNASRELFTSMIQHSQRIMWCQYSPFWGSSLWCLLGTQDPSHTRFAEDKICVQGHSVIVK
jgi:hypothetical protein